MDLVQEFWDALLYDNLNRALLDESFIEFTEDHSGYVYVDGEEGDYGEVKYLCKSTGNLIATKIFHGGDDNEMEFTEYGYDLLTPIAMKIFADALKRGKDRFSKT